LRTRIFKYPCSYLIYSQDFDALPSPAKEYVYRRLFDVLTGREQGPAFARLTGSDRRAILEILVATKPDLPPEWKQYVGKKNSTQATVRGRSEPELARIGERKHESRKDGEL
jgi:hypothetical protein